MRSTWLFPRRPVLMALDGDVAAPSTTQTHRSSHPRTKAMTNDSIQVPDLQRRLAQSAHHQHPLVVDVRHHRQYRRRRIPGSQHISPARLISTEFPDRDLVLIGASEASTRQLISTLYEQGYPRLVQQLKGGIEEWSAAGLPLASDEQKQRSDQNRPIPWTTIAAAASLMLALQQRSPEALLLSLGLLLAPTVLSAWLQRNLFKIERRIL